MDTKSLKPLCAQVECCTPATGAYPVHKSVGLDAPDGVTQSEHGDWRFAFLCDEHAGHVLDANPDNPPAEVEFASRRRAT